jgi:hypothetical protein
MIQLEQKKNDNVREKKLEKQKDLQTSSDRPRMSLTVLTNTFMFSIDDAKGK